MPSDVPNNPPRWTQRIMWAVVLLLLVDLACENAFVRVGGLPQEHLRQIHPYVREGDPYPFYYGTQGWPLQFRIIFESGFFVPAYGNWHPMSLLADIAIAGLIIAAFVVLFKAWRSAGLGGDLCWARIITICIALGVFLLLNLRGDCPNGGLTGYGWPGGAWGMYRECEDTVYDFRQGRFVLGRFVFMVRIFWTNATICLVSIAILSVLVERVLTTLGKWRIRN